MSAYTDKVRHRTLKSGLSAPGSGRQSFEEGSLTSMLYVLKKKIEECHKLLLVFGGNLAQTRS